MKPQRPSKHPRNAWLATFHAWSCHKLCANLAWEMLIGENDARAVHGAACGCCGVLGLSFLMDPYTALALYGSGGYMHSPSPNFTPKEVNIFLDKSICKWCLIFPAPPSESLFVCSSFFLRYLLLPPLPSLGGRGAGGEQSCFSRFRQMAVLWRGVVGRHHGHGWRVPPPSLPESCWLSFGS